ncbi:MAG: LysM peptidoglycan-binding domain-containing protein [Dehalococcoidia bacterium]
MRSRAYVATVSLLLAGILGGCDSGSSTATPTAGATAIPTAAPFASVPSPTVVTRDPNAAPPTGTATPSPTPVASVAAGEEQTYTVVDGDVLGRIAARFNVSADAIRELNKLDGDDIRIGQTLRIPVRPQGSTTTENGVTSYIVKPGDTAFGIALEFDTTVEELERANGVAKGGLDDLQLGQVVKLPPPGRR